MINNFGDSGSIGEELLPDNDKEKLKMKIFTLIQSVNDGDFSLEEAFEAYGITEKEYKAYIKTIDK